MAEELLNETDIMLGSLPVEPTRFDLLQQFVENFYADPDNRIAVTFSPERDKVTIWFWDGGCLIFPASAAQGDIAPFCS